MVGGYEPPGIGSGEATEDHGSIMRQERTNASISLARIYDDPVEGTYRVLVDRLWPRGISKESARLDEWLKDVAPGTELRRWYNHQPERFDEFSVRYRAELSGPPAAQAVEHLLDLAKDRHVVLLTATRDLAHSGAKVLYDVLAGHGDRT